MGRAEKPERRPVARDGARKISGTGMVATDALTLPTRGGKRPGCGALTAALTRCAREPVPGSDRCAEHQPDGAA